MVAIVSMMRITRVEISKKPKCENVQNKVQIRKVWKHSKSYIQCVRHVGNDDLNYVGHSEHYAHQHRRNFEKVNGGTNRNFEKFQNTVNLIYTLCAMSEMVI